MSLLTPSPEHVAIMQALDLALYEAYFSDEPRDLAVAAEAYTVAGFHDGAIMVPAQPHNTILRRVAEARRGRHKRLLRAEARGMVTGLRVLFHAGLLDGNECWRVQNAQWIARGGHDQEPLP